MKVKIALVVFLVIALFAACKKKDTTDSSTVFQTNFTNIAYGTDAAQVMDIYLPAGRSSADTRVMVMLHGGGWISGDKADLSSYVDTIQKRFPNYAVFNVNYRLAGSGINLFPAQEKDVKSAIEFIYSNRNKYAVSDRFALFGLDAGAHLALLQAYKYDSLVKIKAVIDFFGPADLVAMYNAPAYPGGDIAIVNVTGTTPLLDSSLYAQSSPVNFVNSASSPTIIFHGSADDVVSISQSDSLFSKLDSANAAALYKVYPNETHGWAGDTLYNSFNLIQPFLNSRM